MTSGNDLMGREEGRSKSRPGKEGCMDLWISYCKSELNADKECQNPENVADLIQVSPLRAERLKRNRMRCSRNGLRERGGWPASNPDGRIGLTPPDRPT